MSTKRKDPGFKKTRWHRLLGSLLKELLTPLNISVQTEILVTSDPKADIILMRRDEPQWNEAQKALLADGLRDTNASHLLIEFKYTESLNEASFVQILGYDQFYQKGQGLKRHDLQSFLISSKTPTSGILKLLGFRQTEKQGVYISQAPLVHPLRVILLNELSDTPNNAMLKCFASRRTEWNKAFATIENRTLLKKSLPVERLIAGLRRILMRELVPDPEVEGWTPENVMQLGQEWMDSTIRAMPVKELIKRCNMKDLLAGMRTEDRLAGMRPEDVLKHYQLEGQLTVVAEKKSEARVLTRQLQRRFGELPTWAQEKIAKADLSALEKWSLQFVEAQSLEEVFA